MKKILELAVYVALIMFAVFLIEFTLAGEYEREIYGKWNPLFANLYWLFTFQIQFISIIFFSGVIGIVFLLFRVFK